MEDSLKEAKVFVLQTMTRVVAQEGLTLWAGALVGLLEMLQLLSFCLTHHFREIWKEVRWQTSLREGIRLVNGHTLLSDEALLYLGAALVLLVALLVMLARRTERKGHLAVLALRLFCDLFPAILYQPLMRGTVLLVTQGSMA